MNFKFNHLLIASLVIVILGYIFQTSMSLRANSLANSNYHSVSEVYEFKGWLDALELDAITLEQYFGRLTGENISSMHEQLNRFEDYLMSMSQPAFTDDSQFDNAVSHGKSFHDIQSKRLATAESLGFVGHSGIQNEMHAASEDFANSQVFSFSMFSAPNTQVKTAISNFDLKPTMENSLNVETALGALQAISDEFSLGEQETDILKRYKANLISYTQIKIKYVDLIEQAFQASISLHDELETLKISIDGYKDKIQEKTKQDESNTMVFLSSITIILCILITLIVGTVIFNIIKSMKIAQRELSLLEQGDLTRRQKFNSKRYDAIDQVAHSMDRMGQHLLDVIGNVQKSSHDLDSILTDVNSLVEQSSKANEDNSLKTISLTAATEELSATMNEISQNTEAFYKDSKQAAEESQNGTQLVSNVCSKVDIALKAMMQIKQSVERLENQSAEIDSVIELINDIANQTNLLALNAAIEAARAGESGRGFAVVADEVRTLAEKTVSATAKITETIHVLQHETAEATTSVTEGEQTLELINDDSLNALEGIKSIESIVTKNSNSTKQISSAINEISLTITQMSKDTEDISISLQNETETSAKLLERSEMIKSKSTSLAQLVMSFKTNK